MLTATLLTLFLLADPVAPQRTTRPTDTRPQAFEDREQDTRSDPEDAAAYAHADARKPEQDARRFPQQVTRNGGRPTDAPANWVRPPAPDPSIVAYSIDVYEGPGGIGWVANYETLRGGRPFRKHVNFGPEKHRERDWYEVVEPRVP